MYGPERIANDSTRDRTTLIIIKKKEFTTRYKFEMKVIVTGELSVCHSPIIRSMGEVL